jgi:hypothetical protein
MLWLVVVALEAVSVDAQPVALFRPATGLSSTCLRRALRSRSLSSSYVLYDLGLLSCGPGAVTRIHFKEYNGEHLFLAAQAVPVARSSPRARHTYSHVFNTSRLRLPLPAIHIIASEGLMMQNHVHHRRNQRSSLSCQSGDHLDQPGRWA